MKHYRESGQTALDILKNIKAELGIGAGLELVRTVRGADRNCEGVAAGALHKLLNVFGTGVGGVLCADLDLVLDSGKRSQLCLDDDTVVVCILDDLTGKSDVVLKRLRGSVDHNGGKAAVDAGLTKLKAVAVVKMKRNGQTCFDNSSLHQLHKIGVICIGTGALGHLKDERCIELCCSFGDALNDFHVVDVESSYGVTALIRFLKHFGCGNQWHLIISC